MSYIKIHGEETPYTVDIMPFTTQHGYDAVRFIGEEVPITDKGFDFYDDNDQLIADLTKYKYFYSDNAYSVEYDEIESPKGSDAPLPPSPISRLSSRISKVSQRVSQNVNKTDENQAGILDIAELSDENSSAVEDIAIMVDENASAIEDLAEIVGNLELQLNQIKED